MILAYLDLIGGASGDMLLGALLDAGLDLDALRADLGALGLAGWSIERERVSRGGLAATLAHVRTEDTTHSRTLADLLAIVEGSALPDTVRADSARVLSRLAEVEAEIHQTPVEQVHLHELGGLDTILDVVGAVSGLQRLGVERVYASPFPLARGRVEMRHGTWPLPAPATVGLIQRRGAPLVGVEGEFETVTPTGAAILTTLAHDFGPLPALTLRSVGYGAGGRDGGSAQPNVLRVFIGESAESATGEVVESLVWLETNVDDLNPQFYDHILTRLLQAGALDATLQPLQMKKNRPATQVGVLCGLQQAAALRAILLAETTTLGVRQQIVQRFCIAREILSVETLYGTLRVKRAHRPDGQVTVAPEYDDCARAASTHNVPLRVVWEEAQRVARETFTAENAENAEK